MQFAYRWINRDLGKAEFIFSIIVISILLATLVNRSLGLFALAERHLVDATVSNIQTALSLHSAIQAIKADADEKIDITEGMNPVVLLQPATGNFRQYVGNELDYVEAKRATIRPMTNYLGEMYDPDISTLERGNWYFDHNGNLFVYLVKHRELFGEGSKAPTELKYSVKLAYNDVDNNQRYEAGKDILDFATFDRIEAD